MLEKLWAEFDDKLPKLTSNIYISNARNFSKESKLFPINKVYLTDHQKAYYEELELAEKNGVFDEEFPSIHLKYFSDESNSFNLVEIGHVYCRRQEKTVKVILYLEEKQTFEINSEEQLVQFLSSLSEEIEVYQDSVTK